MRHFKETRTEEVVDDGRVEVDVALPKLKNNKAPGMDGIQPALLKYGGAELKKALHDLILVV